LGFDPVSLTHSSNGHACALQYSLLHLAGYKISIDDLKAFRVSQTRYLFSQQYVGTDT
jgi:Transketolase, thiamine diphosphate binding domain